MEAAAAVIGIADAAARASSKIWNLCEQWKDAPQDIYQLRDELDRADRFFSALKEASNQQFPAHVSENISTDLASLLKKGYNTVYTLQLLVDELLCTNFLPGVSAQSRGEDGTVEISKRRRLLWLKKLHKVKRLKATLKQTTEQTGLYLSLLNVTISTEIATSASYFQTQLSIVEASTNPPPYPATPTIETSEKGPQEDAAADISSLHERINTQVEQLDELKSLILGIRDHEKPKPLTKEAFPKWVTPNTPRRVDNTANSCYRNCRCSCHATLHRSEWELSGLSWSLLGSLRLAFSSTSPRPCSDTRCKLGRPANYTRPRRFVAAQYKLPDWLARAVVSLYVSDLGDPELVLRVSKYIDSVREVRDTSIFQYINDGDKDGLKSIITSRPSSVHDVLNGNFSPLFVALKPDVLRSNPETIPLLLQAGADPFYKTTYGGTPLQIAFFRWLASMPGSENFPTLFPFDDLIEQEEYTRLHRIACGLSPAIPNLETELQRPEITDAVNTKTTTALTPLHLAAMTGNVSAVRLLLRAGADPSAVAHNRNTPLSLAFRGKLPDHHPQVIRLLIAAGSNIHCDLGGMNLIHYLCDNSDYRPQDAVNLLDQLVGLGLNPTKASPVTKTSAIQMAAVSNNYHLIPRMVEYGVDINQQDEDGDTALHEAIVNSSYEAAEVLLRLGADCRVLTRRGETVLHMLAKYGDRRMVGILAAEKGVRGVDVDARDRNGKTVFELLGERKRVDEQFRFGFLQLVGGLRRLAMGLPELVSDEGTESEGETETESDEEEFYDAVEG